MLKKRTRGKSCTFQQPWELSIHPTLPGPRYPSTPQRSHLKQSFTDVKSSKVNMQLTMSKSQSGKQHFVCEQPIPHHVPEHPSGQPFLGQHPPPSDGRDVPILQRATLTCEGWESMTQITGFLTITLDCQGDSTPPAEYLLR